MDSLTQAGVPQHSSRRLSENNFDLLRLLFAGTVCLVHAYQMSGFRELSPLADVLSSAVAVKAFFVVSGFLIFKSYEQSSSIASYAWKRIRRIYPAYFTVVMLCAIGLSLVSSVGVGEYFSAAWLRYVAANLAFLNFLQPSLPGVFTGNALPVVNGALWTLKIEVMFYLSVPLFVFLFRRVGHMPVIVATYVGSVAYASLMAFWARQTGAEIYLELGRQLPGQLTYFMAGAFFYYRFSLFERHCGYFVVAAAVILAINAQFPLPAVEPFALAALVAFFGLFLYAGNCGKYGDMSYGIYILHFPVIQLLLHSGWLRAAPWYFLAAAVLVTTASAFAMWHLVEKRFLLRGSHYVERAGAKDAQPSMKPIMPE